MGFQNLAVFFKDVIKKQIRLYRVVNRFRNFSKSMGRVAARRLQVEMIISWKPIISPSSSLM